MKTLSYSIGGVVVTVDYHKDGGFQLKCGQSESRRWRSDQVGFLHADGFIFFYATDAWEGMRSVPYIGLPTTEL